MDEETYLSCDNCGQDVPEADVVDDEWGVHCGDCHDNLFFECGDCCDTYHRSEKRDGYCRDCWSQNLFTCMSCDEVHEIDERVYSNRGYICGSCEDNSFSRCCRCEGLCDHDTLCYNDYDDPYCPSCWEGQRRSGSVHDYDHVPFRWYYNGRTKQSQRTYGLEVELEVGEGRYTRAASKAYEDFSMGERLFYLKEDGSLECGFEIVTHPSTLEFHRDEFPWESLCKAMTDIGARAHNTTTCGLHIHVNRSGLTHTEQIKLGMFIYTNARKVQAVSRRDSNTYSVYLSDYCAEMFNEPRPAHPECNCYECDREHRRRLARWEMLAGKKHRARKMKDLPDGQDKYDAINYDHGNTIEFRMFKGTLKYTTILASLEFVDALIVFIKQTGLAHIVNEKGWHTFMRFVATSDYGYLKKYLKERRIE